MTAPISRRHLQVAGAMQSFPGMSTSGFGLGAELPPCCILPGKFHLFRCVDEGRSGPQLWLRIQGA